MDAGDRGRHVHALGKYSSLHSRGSRKPAVRTPIYPHKGRGPGPKCSFRFMRTSVSVIGPDRQKICSVMTVAHLDCI